MRSPLSLLGLAVFAVSLLSGAAAESDRANDFLFEQLSDPDKDVCIAALRELHTTIDPRLPEALLVLLKDEGNSTRRLAAREIGSRWWQIPKERVPAYLEALRENLQGEAESTPGMESRAISLLSRDYRSPETSRSANGRWVLYERYGLPCLIDTHNESEELLGWGAEGGHGYTTHTYSDREGVTTWHAETEVAAMIVSLDRRTSTAWAWRHRGGLSKLDHGKVIAAAGGDPERHLGPGGFYTDHEGWSGDRIRLQCSFTTLTGALGDPNDPIDQKDYEVEILWNPADGSVELAP